MEVENARPSQPGEVENSRSLPKDDLQHIQNWLQERQRRKRKNKKLPVAYIGGAIALLVAIVVVWIYATHTPKSEKRIYYDLDTGQEIDLEAEKEAGTEIIFEN